MITLLDSVTSSAFGRLASTSPDALAGYDDGRFNNIAQIEREYPNHRHLAIAVFASDDGDCLDIETGDARPEDAPGWLRRQHARGIARPWLYANESTWPLVTERLQQAGIARASFVKWVAVFNEQANLQDDWDAHQYTDHWHQRNVDASVCKDDAFDFLNPPVKHGHHPGHRRHRRPPTIDRKVKAAGLGAALSAGVYAILHAAGVHITPTETAAIATALAGIGGYLVPAA